MAKADETPSAKNRQKERNAFKVILQDWSVGLEKMAPSNLGAEF
jgi:hypothetical protein